MKCADVLLRYKASTEVPNHKNITPLGVACDQGHTAMILLLIERGANVNTKVNDKSLVDCVKNSIKHPKEKCEVLKALLASGCVVNDTQLQEIKASLPLDVHAYWEESLKVAGEARAKNFSKAIGSAAPLPTDSTTDAPMDAISKFVGFQNPLQP